MRLRLAILLAMAAVMRTEPPTGASRGEPPRNTKPQSPPPGDAALKLPPGWPAGAPLPFEKSNCVRCHLTAGRELTVPVRDFARSVHDRAHLTCNDCHGGDTAHDATAHEGHGFIGTKLSAHMAACAGCHQAQGELFRKGKHFWDLTRSINRKYPVCIDCHGNHDVGKPPPDFALTNVCTDCHKQFARDLPQAAAVVAENDRLWKTLRRVQAKNQDAKSAVPSAFQTDVDRVRAASARLIHRAGPISPAEARSVNERAVKLRGRLEEWLRGSPEK